MSDYIKREDAINAIVRRFALDISRSYAKRVMDTVPSADVTEVVRCRDCKHGEVDDANFPNQYLCHRHGSDWNDGEHFCSYGERKDNEYELSVEQLQHDIDFEPTFNSEDGSM